MERVETMMLNVHMGSYCIDAWLEREDPEVRILDNRSGAVLLDWGMKEIRWMVDHGYVGYEEFQDLQSGGGEHFVEELLKLDDDMEGKMNGRKEGEVSIGGGSHHFSEYLCSPQNLISLGV